MILLVTGATGTQGGAVVRELLADGHRVRALVRDPAAPAALALAQAGAMLAPGSYENAASLRAALHGADGLFSVQAAPGADRDSERRQARALFDAAIAEQVRHVVHSSVSNTGAFRTTDGWAQGRWEPNYWESKADVERMVRDGPFPVATILRPAFMMENFASPKSAWMFPDLSGGAIRTAVAPDTAMILIAAQDIARVAAATFAAPAAYAGRTIELAGDMLTLPQVAAVIAAVKGVDVVAESCDPETLVAGGQHDGWVQTQQWMNIVNYPARPAEMAALGVAPTRFADWARRNADAIIIHSARREG